MSPSWIDTELLPAIDRARKQDWTAEAALEFLRSWSERITQAARDGLLDERSCEHAHAVLRQGLVDFAGLEVRHQSDPGVWQDDVAEVDQPHTRAP
jgi:hypothetical protein